MVIHFESFGNFTTEIESYRALTSKKSRGTIQLTEKSFSFKSEKDKIIYDIKLPSIQNFYYLKRFRLTYIEMISDQGIIYNFYPIQKKDNSFTITRSLTQDLFRSLLRAVYKGDYPILFETKAYLITKELEESIFQEKRSNGILLLTEEYLMFKAFSKDTIKKIHILDIKEIIYHNEKSDYFTQVRLNDNTSLYIITLKSKSARNRRDREKTVKLQELLVQVKEYKISEKLKEKQEEKNRIERLKALFEVSNKVRLDMIRVVLEMDEIEFTKKVFEWAKKFKFIIDGDFLIVNIDTISEFIDNLKMGFDFSIRSELKIYCKYCEKRIDYTANICPYCGKEQMEV